MSKRGGSDDAPLGTFEEQVMVVILREGNEAYAMPLRRELEALTDRSVAIGSVYVTLDRLEAKGLVSSRRTQREDSISRRLFAVTAEGVAALSRTRAIRERLWKGLDIGRLVRKNT